MVFNPVGGQETRLAGIWLRTIATSADPVPATFGVQNQGKAWAGPDGVQNQGKASGRAQGRDFLWQSDNLFAHKNF